MNLHPPTCLTLAEAHQRARLPEGFGANAPGQLFTLGNLDLLPLPKIARFGSARCPGDDRV
jgi:hypothetical protein